MAKVAILIADGFAKTEMSIPAQRLADEGHRFVLLGAELGRALASDDGQLPVHAEAGISHHRVDEFDALLIPGGRSPVALAQDPEVLSWVAAFCRMGRPVGAIGTGPRLLLAAHQALDRRITAAPEIQDQLRAQGADLVDEPVVSDGAFTTGRGAGDVESFIAQWLVPVGYRPELEPQPLQR